MTLRTQSTTDDRSLRGWRFWLRTGWWAFTHPFSPTDDNPGVQASLDDFAEEARRIDRQHIVNALRMRAVLSAEDNAVYARGIAAAADYIENGTFARTDYEPCSACGGRGHEVADGIVNTDFPCRRCGGTGHA